MKRCPSPRTLAAPTWSTPPAAVTASMRSVLLMRFRAVRPDDHGVPCRSAARTLNAYRPTWGAENLATGSPGPGVPRGRRLAAKRVGRSTLVWLQYDNVS